MKFDRTSFRSAHFIRMQEACVYVRFAQLAILANNGFYLLFLITVNPGNCFKAWFYTMDSQFGMYGFAAINI